MSCNGCTETTTNCNEDCLGCQYQLPTNCVVLEKKLTCSGKPAGTDLSIILEQFCVKITTLETTLGDLTVSASDIEVTTLDCLSASVVSGSDLQSTLEDLCDLINGIETDITDAQDDIAAIELTLAGGSYTGTFVEHTGKTVTVTKGLITSVV